MAMLVPTLPPECPAPIDEPPGNFDATTQPIIAVHWFGLPRKWACGRRPPGPGEIARSHGVRKRGVHLRLVEVWQP